MILPGIYCLSNTASLKFYKIMFENNLPVSAILMDNIYEKSVKTDTLEGKRMVKWITTFARDEQEGIDTANEMVAAMNAYLF